jgi:predicted transposase YdaD
LSTGRAEGEAIGEARGEARRIEEQQKIVKNLIKLGIAIDIIIKSTGLTREEVETIKTSIL